MMLTCKPWSNKLQMIFYETRCNVPDLDEYRPNRGDPNDYEEYFNCPPIKRRTPAKGELVYKKTVRRLLS